MVRPHVYRHRLLLLLLIVCVIDVASLLGGFYIPHFCLFILYVAYAAFADGLITEAGGLRG